jgi:hypothetical protein
MVTTRMDTRASYSSHKLQGILDNIRDEGNHHTKRRERHLWIDDDLKKAIAVVDNGSSIHTIAKYANIPKTTF